MIPRLSFALALLIAVPAMAAGKTQLFLEHIAVDDGPIYFPDELAPVADSLAEVLSRPENGGYEVIPPTKLRALWADTQAGKLPGVAAVCGRPPPPEALTRALYPDAAQASIEVGCEKAVCKLTVAVNRVPPRGTGQPRLLARSETTLARDASPKDWAEALRKGGLKPAKPPKDSGGGGIFGLAGMADMKPGLYLNVREIESTGPWPQPLTEASFEPMSEGLKVCQKKSKRSSDWWAQDLLIEIDPAGKVTRCELSLPDHLPLGEELCQCDVLRGSSWAPSTSSRRARVSLDIDEVEAPQPGQPSDGAYRSVYFSPTRSSDPTATLGNPDTDHKAESACLWGVKSLPETEVVVQLDVLADGRVASHTEKWPASLSTKAAECLGATLSRMQFNCPLKGSAQVTGKLTLEVR